MREKDLYDKFREQLDFIEHQFAEDLSSANASQMGNIQTQIGQLQAQKVKLQQQEQQIDQRIANLQKQLSTMQANNPSTLNST